MSVIGSAAMVEGMLAPTIKYTKERIILANSSVRPSIIHSRLLRMKEF
jgi:hypothetical protein